MLFLFCIFLFFYINVVVNFINIFCFDNVKKFVINFCDVICFDIFFVKIIDVVNSFYIICFFIKSICNFSEKWIVSCVKFI